MDVLALASFAQSRDLRWGDTSSSDHSEEPQGEKLPGRGRTGQLATTMTA